jgi:hypothetical protein
MRKTRAREAIKKGKAKITFFSGLLSSFPITA